MAGNGTGGPWGNGGGNRGPGNNGGGDRPPSNGGQGPDLDDLVRKGQEQLRVLMGGRGGAKNKNNPPKGGGRWSRTWLRWIWIDLYCVIWSLGF